MSAQTDYPFPWNPDADLDGWVSTEDLLLLLTVFGTQFEPDTWETDSISAAVVLDGNHNYFQCQSHCNDIEGNWRMADLDAFGRHFDLASSVSAYFWVNGNDKLNSSDFAYDTYQLFGPTGDMDNVSVNNFSQGKRCMCYIQSSPFVPSEHTVDSNLELWGSVADLQEQMDSLQMIIDSFGMLDSFPPEESLRIDSIVCVDYGVGYQCSPQGGFCSDITNDITSDGSGMPYFVLNETCYTQFDVSLCVRPNWRRFRAYGINLSTVTHVLLTGNYSTAADGTGDYRVNQIIRSAEIFNQTNDSFDFYVATNPPIEGASYLSIQEHSYNTNSPYIDFGKLLSLSVGGPNYIFESGHIFRFKEW